MDEWFGFQVAFIVALGKTEKVKQQEQAGKCYGGQRGQSKQQCKCGG